MGKFSNISKTLYSYFNSFLPSFLEEKVPIDTKYPYGTYSLSFDDNFDDNLIQFRIYSKSTSMAEVAKYADMVAENIGKGVLIECSEGGKLWIKAGSPFQQFMPEENINSVYINIIINYLV